jgi:hypothetical protein
MPALSADSRHDSARIAGCRCHPGLIGRADGTETLLFCCVGCVLVFRVIGNAGEGGRADWFLAKLGLAALLSGNIMLFQSLTYFGALDALGPEVIRTSSWIMFVSSLAVFALLGVPMLRIAIKGLFRGPAHARDSDRLRRIGGHRFFGRANRCTAAGISTMTRERWCWYS